VLPWQHHRPAQEAGKKQRHMKEEQPCMEPPGCMDANDGENKGFSQEPHRAEPLTG
jgi:hypothetical protein